MTANEIRAAFLDFFQRRDHIVIPSASLVPENDPTTLFTGSGMQPLVPYLLGKDHPAGNRLANSQKCFRAMDIDEVGDNRHTTFFEMLGNWSLGNYFKKEQLSYFFEFLVDVIHLDPRRLYVTVFIGDEKTGIPKDDESAAIWKELFSQRGIAAKEVSLGSGEEGSRTGMQDGRIFYYGAEKNWWSRAGTPDQMPAGEPGGPDSEVFYDFGTAHDIRFGTYCHPNCDCGRFLEIGNSVFMQYMKSSDGSFALLPKLNVDFGGGLERITAAAGGNPDIFRIDLFADIIALLQHYADEKQYDDPKHTKSFRIIADHIRAAVFMIADGVRPSNTDRGYMLRRLLRRAAHHAIALGAAQGQEENNELVRCAMLVVEKYKEAYPELDGENVYKKIWETIWEEEKQFARALDMGKRAFDKIVSAEGALSGKSATMLVTTYGLPLETAIDLARERGIDVDEREITETHKRLMDEHREVSRAGVTQKFKGGLADSSEKTTRLHTAHHLLLAALQLILGRAVKQRGSNITQDRLRIDFSFERKVSDEELKEVERIVNEKIHEELPVIRTLMSKSEAEKLGAQQEFGAKYPDQVSVYSIGPETATDDDPKFEKAFSLEFCGGPHVNNTRELASIIHPDGPDRKGSFKIVKEEAVASGIRRIKAVLL
ncbi:MAG: alanyl-tRNA synthetase [Parcubacteria group bacterium GW2011_GWA2_51_10]|nr:MAG: alanyl-tRNA synthetase [Parcubacteria group bacterium GW2011_GWA2_51_10]